MAINPKRILLLCGLTLVVWIAADPPAATRVSGNLVFWDQSRGFESIAANADLFSEISPFWYRVLANGRVEPYTRPDGGTYEDPAILAFLRSRRILVIPTVANVINGVWDGAAVSRIITDPQLRAFNISNLVDLAVGRGYDGIDLDYESLRERDRAAFTIFVQNLAAALHAKGKLLTVNVYAKTAEPGTWDGPRAQDWFAIGRAADQVRIMTYEYSWSTSPPGPIAPVNWVDDVMTFARSKIARERLVLGVPLYGYDWVGQSATDLVWSQAVALANQHAVAVRWDDASAAPWFEYRADSARHTVWFENASSADAKLDVAVWSNIGGVTIWRLGGEDPRTWSSLRSRLAATPFRLLD